MHSATYKGTKQVSWKMSALLNNLSEIKSEPLPCTRSPHGRVSRSSSDSELPPRRRGNKGVVHSTLIKAMQKVTAFILPPVLFAEKS